MKKIPYSNNIMRCFFMNFSKQPLLRQAEHIIDTYSKKKKTNALYKVCLISFGCISLGALIALLIWSTI